MRPYLAVIRDSFHEALASRVLWILLGLSTLLLLALAPLGVSERAGGAPTSGDASAQASPRGPRQMQFFYLFMNVGDPVSIDRGDLVFGVNAVLHVGLFLALGVGGVLVAILVTSSIIPQTFEAGAIDLLLSKPISRPLLYLTKFAGGCAFILLIVSWLVVGLWLILGLRFGIWQPRLLLCIPLYLFLFAIYYSVSGLAGVIWKNAIVSVVLTILFWFVCFSIGKTKDVFETWVVNPQRLVKLVAAGETLLAVRESGSVARWREAGGVWEDVFERGDDGAPGFGVGRLGPMLGPVYDAERQRIFAADTMLQQFGAPSESGPLLIGSRSQDWRRVDGPALPHGAAALLVDAQGTPLVVTPQALFRLDGEILEDSKPKSINFFGFELSLEVKGPKFVEISDISPLSRPVSAAWDAARSELAVFDGQRLAIIAPEADGKSRVRLETELDDRLAGAIAYSGPTLLLALADGQSRIYDPADLRLKQTFSLPSKGAPRFAAASADGRWAAAGYRDGRLWLYDSRKQAECEFAASLPLGARAVAFAAPNLLHVAHADNRVTTYDLDAGTIRQQRQSALSIWEAGYRYLVQPIYTIFPKPGDLDNMVHYLLTDETRVSFGGQMDDPRLAQDEIDVWGPVWSNLAFLTVVLAIGCVYVSRKDF